ncbi:MAG: hypothetical protein ACRCXM_13110 [Beijerinckiaceae bacterium]
MATTMLAAGHLTIAVPEARKRAGFFSRLKAAIIESRMKAAEREITRYHAMREDLYAGRAESALAQRNALPF